MLFGGAGRLALAGNSDLLPSPCRHSGFGKTALRFVHCGAVSNRL